MERLTKRMIVPSTGEVMGYILKPGVSEWKLKNKLGAYEDAEEQGILLRLPCKPGDDVYIIPSKTNYDLNVLHKCEGYNRVYHQKAHRVTVADGHWFIECDKDNEYGTGRILTDISYKKTWFLNEPEAEKALAEMG